MNKNIVICVLCFGLCILNAERAFAFDSTSPLKTVQKQPSLSQDNTLDIRKIQQQQNQILNDPAQLNGQMQIFCHQYTTTGLQFISRRSRGEAKEDVLNSLYKKWRAENITMTPEQSKVIHSIFNGLLTSAYSLNLNAVATDEQKNQYIIKMNDYCLKNVAPLIVAEILRKLPTPPIKEFPAVR